MSLREWEWVSVLLTSLSTQDILFLSELLWQKTTYPLSVSLGTVQEVDGYFSTLSVECAVVILGEHRGHRLVYELHNYPTLSWVFRLSLALKHSSLVRQRLRNRCCYHGERNNIQHTWEREGSEGYQGVLGWRCHLFWAQSCSCCVWQVLCWCKLWALSDGGWVQKWSSRGKLVQLSCISLSLMQEVS